MMKKIFTSYFWVFFFLYGLFAHDLQGGCAQNTRLSSLSGAFEDGSGVNNYENNLQCSWVIAPAGAVSILLSVSNLDLGFGDVLRVFQGSNSSGIIVAEYRRGSAPGIVNIEAGQAYVEFITDGISVGQGWRISYSSASVPCLPPNSITLSSVGKTQAAFFWQPNLSADWYEAEYRGLDPIEDWQKLPPTQEANLLVSDLRPDKAYALRIRLRCFNGNFSGWSNEVRFTTAPLSATPRCPIPENLRAGVENNPAGKFIAVTWEVNLPQILSENRTQVGTSRFEAQLRRSSRFQNENEGWIRVVTNEPRLLLRDQLTPNLVYDFRVRTICAQADSSPFSNIITFQAPADLGPSTGRFCMQTNKLQVTPGETIELDVNAYEINQRLISASWQISYNPNLASFLDARKKDFIPSANQELEVKPSLGVIQVSLSGASPSTNQSGTLFTLRFQVNALLPQSQDLVFGLHQASAITLSRQTIDIQTCPDLSIRAISPCPIARIIANGPTQLCQGQSAILQANLGADYTYQWYKDGELLRAETQAFLQVTQTANYAVHISAPGCLVSVSQPLRVTFNPRPQFAATLLQPTRAGIRDGAITVETQAGTAPFTYGLNERLFENKPRTFEFRELAAGNYSLFVIDANGCQVTRNLVLENRIPCPEAILLPHGNIPLCEAGSLQLVTTFGQGYAYRWFKNDVFLTQTLENKLIVNAPGSYRVQILAEACPRSVSPAANVILQNNISLQAQVTNASSPTVSDGAIRVHASGGTGVYTYALNHNQKVIAAGPVDFNGLKTGEYTITVQDEAGCGKVESFFVGVLPPSGSEPCASPSAIRHNTHNNIVNFSWQENQSVNCVVLSVGTSLEGANQWRTYLIPRGVRSFSLQNLSSGTYFYQLQSNCSICSATAGVLSAPSSLNSFTIGLNKGSFEPEGENDSWRVYPNPSAGSFSLEALAEITYPTYVSVTDLNGKIILSQIINKDQNIHSFVLGQSGVYFLKIQSAESQKVVKVIVQ
jgi:uncharacterized protein (DUF2141 family)